MIMVVFDKAFKDAKGKQVGRVCGTAALLIEDKFIHGNGKVGHIEDVVTLEEYRGKGLGKALVQALSAISQSQGCYKVGG